MKLSKDHKKIPRKEETNSGPHFYSLKYGIRKKTVKYTNKQKYLFFFYIVFCKLLGAAAPLSDILSSTVSHKVFIAGLYRIAVYFNSVPGSAGVQCSPF